MQLSGLILDLLNQNLLRWGPAIGVWTTLPGDPDGLFQRVRLRGEHEEGDGKCEEQLF